MTVDRSSSGGSAVPYVMRPTSGFDVNHNGANGPESVPSSSKGGATGCDVAAYDCRIAAKSAP